MLVAPGNLKILAAISIQSAKSVGCMPLLSFINDGTAVPVSEVTTYQ